MNKVAIMGVGSLGTVLGAYLSKEIQIDLIDTNVEHVEALNKNGATVTGKVEMNVPVKALTPDKMEGTYDLVFFMVKQMYNKTAIEQLKDHLHKDSVVCTLQNGYPEAALVDEIGEDRVLGCTVAWGATWIMPGVSELTSEMENMEFSLGRIDGKITDAVIETQKILSYMCQTHITQKLTETRWIKLMTNAAFSGMSAALGCTFGEIMDNEVTFPYLQYTMNEMIKVGAASGIPELHHGGIDLRPMFEFSSEEDRIKTQPLYEKIWGPHRLLRASMLQDLEKGRKCEIDAINGVVSTQGIRYGVLTPFCDKVIEIVKGIELGEYSSSMENSGLLKEVLDNNRL